MRPNDGLFKCGQSLCGVSLAAMLVLPCLRGASAAGPIAVIVPLHAAAGAGGDDHIELLTEIWQDAWLLDYVPFESGMVIVPVDEGEWFVLGLRMNLHRYCPPSLVHDVESNPNWQAILTEWGIDDGCADRLMGMANALTDVTGIHVQVDEAY